MSTENSTRRARPADRRRQLIAHAVTLFAERGYAHVSLADIARAAGVTAPALYRHFPDKQSLLAASVMTGIDDLQACTDHAVHNGHGTGGAATADLIGALSALGARRPDAISLWRNVRPHLSDEQNRQVVVRTQQIVHDWSVLVTGITHESDRAGTDLAWAILSVAGSLAVHTTRLPAGRAAAELETLINRLLALHPDRAQPLPVVPPTSAGPPTRRDEILDAAARLFAERGYSGVGVDEIGAAVGITGPSVYKHFSSKLAVLLAVGQRGAARLEAGVLAAYARASEPADLLAALVDSYVSVITSTPDLSVAFDNSYALAGQLTASDLNDAQRRYVSRWIDLLRQTDDALDRPRAAVAVHAALSIVNDAVRLGRGTSRDDFGPRMALLMTGVLGVSAPD